MIPDDDDEEANVMRQIFINEEREGERDGKHHRE